MSIILSPRGTWKGQAEISWTLKCDSSIALMLGGKGVHLNRSVFYLIGNCESRFFYIHSS